MAEPITTAGLTSALSAGAGALLISWIGIEPQPLFWSLIGATIGLSFAGKTGLLRTAIVFVCVVLAAALLGTLLAQVLAETPAMARIARNAAAFGTAVLFHPLLLAAINAVPTLMQGVLKRLGIGGQT